MSSMAYESWATSEATRKTMQGNKRRDTRPELALRRAVHALGLRYRVDSPPIEGVRRRADLLFPARRVAVYLDGCFWHGCPSHYRPPATNAVYWTAKVERNRDRDRHTNELLVSQGWIVVRVWEHEDPVAAAAHVASVVRRR